MNKNEWNDLVTHITIDDMASMLKMSNTNINNSIEDHLDDKIIKVSDLIVEMLRHGAYYNSTLCTRYHTNYLEVIGDEVVGDNNNNKELPISVESFKRQLETYTSDTYEWRRYLF